MDEQTYPRVTVGAFIRNDKKEVLLCQSPKWSGNWVVCGGHINLGETIKHALVREVKEEVGLDVEYLRVISSADFINNPHFYKPYHFVGLQCECKLINNVQKPLIDQKEITKARWFSLSEAINLPNILEETKITLVKLAKEESHG